MWLKNTRRNTPPRVVRLKMLYYINFYIKINRVTYAAEAEEILRFSTF